MTELLAHEVEFRNVLTAARQRELERLKRMQFPEYYPKHISRDTENLEGQSLRIVRAPAQGGAKDTKRMYYGS